MKRCHLAAPGSYDGYDADVLLIGGGLANLVIAWRLAEVRPDLSIVIIERGERLGGNHTWSFHGPDISPAQHAWLAPLVVHAWPRQEVRFPSQSRILETSYHSLVSGHVARLVGDRIGAGVRTGIDAVDVSANAVRLSDQSVVTARLVIDGRGAIAAPALALGYQKFVGLEVETVAPHGQQHPIIMDATVSQGDGYRFVYTLPLSPTRILIEDTYYSDDAGLDDGHLDDSVFAYATERGWQIATVERRERGVLPIALAGDLDAHWRSLDREVAHVGLRAWLFHPTTGYSLPYAVRLADAVAAAPDLTSSSIARLVERHARQVWSEQAVFRLLNRMLFVAAEPHQRVTVMGRFYRLSQPLIERFYAARLTTSDTVRIFTGKPPISIEKALRAMPPSAGWAKVSGATGGRGPA